MPKKSNIYLKADPYKIIEDGFHKDRAQVSESVFSLGNEYLGVRGFFEEGYSGQKLIGTYFNGIYEYALEETPNAYRGIVKRTHFTINSVNFFKCSIVANKYKLDLNTCSISSFYRELDMKTGLYTRQFIWNLEDGNLFVKFERLIHMENCHEALQRLHLKADKEMDVELSLELDSNILHWNSDCYWKRVDEFKQDDIYGLRVKTLSTNQSLVSVMTMDIKPTSYELKEKEVVAKYHIHLKANEEFSITKFIINLIDKSSISYLDEMKSKAIEEVCKLKQRGFIKALNENESYFSNVWKNKDIEIGGDVLSQQGIRYCIFQLEQAYHGYAIDNNIGAKGLTGEAYSGHAFWDSETYCLPYYLFTNQQASKNLLMFRYRTLKEAKDRAKELDCEGACYPIATRNGKEGCNLWQHASLQFQPSTGVFYAIYHYMNLYNDEEFLKDYGLEMIVEIAKFLLSRGQYNSNHTKFSFYNVMGPDEFQMMVNHNTYTNFMAKKVFDYLLDIIDNQTLDCERVFAKCNFSLSHINKMRDASEKMVILYDDETKLFEQHDGFFDLPHIDIQQIPVSEFPLYAHWSYDRIYRNDMIKQPDVLMFMFLYNQDFTFEQKLANYEYYEPRCIHESSLSPSVHSIFACELGKYDDALRFFDFATRLDLDDYNCNTNEGIHMTSIAAAWMNIVYGFGGLRSDKRILSLNPILMDKWDYYSFNLKYRNANLKVYVEKNKVTITTSSPVDLIVYGKVVHIESQYIVERSLCKN